MALLGANDCCKGEKFEVSVDEICHFVLVVSSKLNFQDFVVMSQGEQK